MLSMCDLWSVKHPEMVRAAHRCVKQTMWCADTYVDDERRVVFFQSTSQPQEVLVAPPYFVLTGVELAPHCLERETHHTTKLQPGPSECYHLHLVMIHTPEPTFMIMIMTNI